MIQQESQKTKTKDKISACFPDLTNVQPSDTPMSKEETDAELAQRPLISRAGAATAKILYKGYYYKIRVEGRKKFILTKKEGQVSLADAKKWLKKNKK
jgi:hypothetical protein